MNALKHLIAAGLTLVVTAAAAENAVTIWDQYAVDASLPARPQADAEYLTALASLAVWDAILANEHPGAYEPYAAELDVERPASSDAAVATAAFEVLRTRIPAQAAVLQQRYDDFMAGIPDGDEKDNGVALGTDAALAVLAARSGDGFDNVVVYVQPPPGPGVFEPTNANAPASQKLSQVQPLSNRNIGDFLPRRPHNLKSDRYAQDLNEVAALGRATDSQRTPEQTETAMFWTETTITHNARSMHELSEREGLDAFETARMLAMAHGCSADSLLEGFYAKYHYLFWRPFHSVPRADTDGNDATDAVDGWLPLLNVNHPEYPSAHAFWSAAWAVAMQRFLGYNTINWEISSTATNTVRTYETLDDLVNEVGNARIYAGLHYRFSVEAGERVGRRVCRHFLDNHLRELPL